MERFYVVRIQTPDSGSSETIGAQIHNYHVRIQTPKRMIEFNTGLLPVIARISEEIQNDLISEHCKSDRTVN